jgi:hypothetical protein
MDIDYKEQYILTIILGKLGFSNLGFFLTKVCMCISAKYFGKQHFLSSKLVT